MKILVLNGPNINMLGLREENVYGSETYDELQNKMNQYGAENGIDFYFIQSPYEGALVEAINDYFGYDGIIINPAAYSHYSIAIYDALLIPKIPKVEVHISHVHARESFRHKLVTTPACNASITGMGLEGYLMAAQYIQKKVLESKINELEICTA